MRRIHGVILLLCLLCSMLLIGCQNKVNNEPSTSPADVNELDPEITTSMAPGPDDDYRNPVLNGYADPDVLLYEGVYYLYATGAEGYLVHTSTDLKEWEVTARAVYPDLWGIQTNYWAPDVEYINGKFYMVVTCEEKLGMAVSDSPLGPFEEAHDSVMYEHSLDGHLFVDDDGSIYLYFSSWRPGLPHGIYGVLLNDDMRPIPETETLLLVPEEDWEKYGYGVVEGPFILKREGIYYLTYSGSDYRSPNYAVGYATSESPLGTYERYEENPILVGNERVAGTGHHTITTSLDGTEMWIVYHRHANVVQVHPRAICIDRIVFREVENRPDVLEVLGPTTFP